MKIIKWEQLPSEMQTEAVRKYYDILKKKKFSLLMKRGFDILASMIALIVFSPVFMILAITIKIDSPGPIFYRQERITQYGRRFRIHKFRTMVQGADKGSQVTVKNDSRITRVGKVIRACKLDEIAQLLDVICGNMSFVGTRPEAVKYVKEYKPEYYATLLMPAGITSEASIRFRNEDKLLKAEDDVDKVYMEEILPIKMKWNLKSIREFCFYRDFLTIWRTVFAILGKDYNETRYIETLKEETSLDE